MPGPFSDERIDVGDAMVVMHDALVGLVVGTVVGAPL